MSRLLIAVTLCASAGVVQAEELFVSIQKVSGNQLAVVKQPAGGGGGRGMRGGQGGGRFAGRGPRGWANSSQVVIVTVPTSAKITSAMRERRTFEFRVGAELAGGLKNPLFRNLTEPLSARIVSHGNRITEVNVITDATDINQTNTDRDSGKTVIAVRPKRPPMKK